MKCHYPKLAFRNPDGGRPLFTKYQWSSFIHHLNGFANPAFKEFVVNFQKLEALKMPCGKCPACKLENARQISVRAQHELKMHNGIGAFLTLTYKVVPDGGGYVKEDIVRFVKRLRRHIKEKIKTYGCAEYGGRNLRPHFHLLVFGYDFPDRYFWRKSSSHDPCNVSYRSNFLDRLWSGHDSNLGMAEFGSLTGKSAAYVARYTQKKAEGRFLPDHLPPERSVCIPRQEGLGKSFFLKYVDDIYNTDVIHLDFLKQGVPRYYDKLLEKMDPVRFEFVKKNRVSKRKQFVEEDGCVRMKNKVEFHLNVIKKLKRGLYE